MSWADIKTPANPDWPTRIMVGECEWEHRYNGTYIARSKEDMFQPPELFPLKGGGFYAAVLKSTDGAKQAMKVSRMGDGIWVAQPLVKDGTFDKDLAENIIGMKTMRIQEVFHEIYAGTRYARKNLNRLDTREGIRLVAATKLIALDVTEQLARYGLQMMTEPASAKAEQGVVIRHIYGGTVTQSALDNELCEVVHLGRSIPCRVDTGLTYAENRLALLGRRRYLVEIRDGVVITKATAIGSAVEKFRAVNPADVGSLFLAIFSSSIAAVIDELATQDQDLKSFYAAVAWLQEQGVDLDLALIALEEARDSWNRRVAEDVYNHTVNIAFNLGLSDRTDEIEPLPVFAPLRAMAGIDAIASQPESSALPGGGNVAP